MKTIVRFLVLLLGFSLLVADAEARGFGGGNRQAAGGKANRAAMQRNTQRANVNRQQQLARQRQQQQARQRQQQQARQRQQQQARQRQQASMRQQQQSRKAAAQRNAFTGSKVQRPKAKPQARPATVSRPQAKPQARPQARPQPTTRPSVQRPSVQRPTVQRPSGQNPGARPAPTPGITRPGGANTRPGANRPAANNRPGVAARPDTRPAIKNPNRQRPSTLPGMVTYPNRPGQPGRPGANRPGNNNRPDIANRPGNNNRPGVTRPGNNNRPGVTRPGNNVRPGVNPAHRRPTVINRPQVNIGQVNVGGRNVGISRPSTLPAQRRNNWNTNRWGGNRGVWGNHVNVGNNVNINVNNRFYNNNNYACRPRYWGARPWWGTSYYHGWHHGHWNYGWSTRYYNRHWYFRDDNDFAKGFMWGIASWSFGKMIYDMGYKTYSNPYPAPPVQNTYVNYAQPVSVAAAENPPGDDEAMATAEEKSTEAFEESKANFAIGDYPTALKKIDEALAQTPDDVTLHEYRALVMFALGQYGHAAGVLNAVLASGPGWGWDTMIGFYNSSSTYNDQLRKLEDYVNGTPDAADARFLLGYHYMVCGHMPESHEQFAEAAELQPADTVSAQLRDLTADSVGEDGDEAPPEPEIPDPVPAEKLPGTWSSDNGDAGKVTMTLKDGGDFTWTYQPAGDAEASELEGSYGLDDQGLLVLTMDDAQMISEIRMSEDDTLHFELIGAPEGDPGLDFTKG